MPEDPMREEEHKPDDAWSIGHMRAHSPVVRHENEWLDSTLTIVGIGRNGRCVITITIYDVPEGAKCFVNVVGEKTLAYRIVAPVRVSTG